jgi:pyruvate dehydrogenase E1 component beta subunit
MAKMRMRQAIATALADEMERDPSVIVIGEDVAAAGGVFKASEGLLDRFGPLRVRDTPIAEMGFLGAAVGAAATGLRPVTEIMFAEFLGVALDQLSTEAAKLRYLSGGELSVPLVVRQSVGPGLGFGAQHSQTLETWLYATPGLKVVSPSGAGSAYGLLRSAIRDDDPVVFLEPRILYGEREDVQLGEDAVIPLGQARIAQAGTDVTVVALGQTVPTALKACDAATGWSGEVIDLQTIVPWDKRTVLESVAKTRRLVIVEANPYSGGWGTEIAAEVAAELFGELAAPVARVTTPDAPVPFPKPLEDRFVPSPDDVRTTAEQLLTTGRRPVPWWQKEDVR